jgi:hypothetical protein
VDVVVGMKKRKSEGVGKKFPKAVKAISFSANGVVFTFCRTFIVPIVVRAIHRFVNVTREIS